MPTKVKHEAPSARKRDRTSEQSPRVAVLLLKKIFIPDELEKDHNFENAAAIAESLQEGEIINPVTVRLVKFRIGMAVNERYELIAGVDRIHAVTLANKDRIECKIVDVDDNTAWMMRIEENLMRKRITVLRRAELEFEWVTRFAEKLGVSDQNVPKKIGRPLSDLTKALAHLPLYSGSLDARKQAFKRTRKIALISSEGKAAAKEAGLDDNQDALLAIAAAGDFQAQVAKAKRVAKERGTSEPPSDPPHSAGASSRGDNVKRSETPADATFEDVMTLWKKHRMPAVWVRVPKQARERVLEHLASRPCRAAVDYRSFIDAAFQGHAELKSKQLKEWAEKRGLAWGTLRNHLNALGYKARKRGSGVNARWLRVNINKDAKEQPPHRDFAEFLGSKPTKSPAYLED